jgi:tape measure domain-containing protein
MTMGQRAGAAGGAFLYGGGMGGGAGSALGGIAGGLAGGVPGAFAGAALGQLADNIGQALGATASYTAEIDKQRIALKNVTKDVAEYENALAFIDRTSRNLAIPQDILNKQFTQLSASVIGAGGDINLAQEAFIGIAAGIRGTGGSLADMEGALRATAQVFSKGKVSAEELRQQIGERLPGAFTLFAKSMGKTPQELDKMLEQGQVTLNDFMGFVRTLSGEYGASASKIAASSQAAGDRLATTMSRMREAVGRELQPLGAQFQEILANAVADNEGNLVALAKAFSEAAQAIGRFIEQYGGLIASLGSTILLVGGTVLAVKGLAIAYAAIGPAIATAAAAIASYGGALSVAKLAMAGLGGPITLTIAGLVLLGKGVYDTNETFRNFVNNIGGIIASDFKNAVDGMAEDARSSADNIQTAYEDLTTKLDPIGQFIRELFADVFKDTSDSAEASATASSGSFNDFFNSLSTSATEGFNGLNTIISNWWSSLPAPIRNIFAGNAASMLVGAAGYAAALPSRTSQGKPERQGPYLPPNLPNRNAKPTPLGSFPNGSGSGSGSGGKNKKAKELEDYIRQEQDFLRQLAQIGQNRLETTMGLSNEELNISKAQSEFRASNAINEQQYLEDQRNAAKYSVETRDQYLKDIKEKYDNEKTLIQQQFDQSAYAPFLALERQLIGENEELAASLRRAKTRKA